MATSVTATKRKTSLLSSVNTKGTDYHPGFQLESETVPLNPGLCEQPTLREKQHETDWPKLEFNEKRYSYG